MIREFQGQHRWLSNFWRVSIKHDAYNFTSVEHAYQASKCKNQSDKYLIFGAESPGEAKRLGKKVEVREDWEAIKLSVMEELVRKKFQNPELRKKLLATGTEFIQEGNYWHDTFWGVDLRTGKGENHLGKIIMKIRDEMKGG